MCSRSPVAASASFCDAWNSPSAWMTFARRLPFGFGLTRHGPLHLDGKIDLLHFHVGDLDAPRLGVVSMIFWSSLLILSRSASSSSSADWPRMLRSVVCESCDVAKRKFSTSTIGLVGLHDPEVDDRVDLDGDVVLGDDVLRRDVHDHRPQADLDHLVDDRDQEDDARALSRRSAGRAGR